MKGAKGSGRGESMGKGKMNRRLEKLHAELRSRTIQSMLTSGELKITEMGRKRKARKP